MARSKKEIKSEIPLEVLRKAINQEGRQINNENLISGQTQEAREKAGKK